MNGNDLMGTLTSEQNTMKRHIESIQGQIQNLQISIENRQAKILQLQELEAELLAMTDVEYKKKHIDKK